MAFWMVLGITALLGVDPAVLEGPDTPARAGAIDRLVAQGPAGLARLGEALLEAGWRGREGIIDALERIGPAAVPLLMQAARTHPREDARRLAALALGRIGGAAARDSLARLVDTAERDIVLAALGEAGDPAVAPVVARFLKDGRANVRRRAVVALAKLSGAAAADRVVEALSDGHHGVRYAAAGALEGMGPAAGAALLRRLNALRGPALFLAVRTLGRLRYRPAAGALAGALAAQDWAVRAAAAEALGRLGGEGLPERLDRALRKEAHPFVAFRIREALKGAGTR